MVTREYHQSRVFDTICHVTSQAVKSTGLQLWESTENDNISDLDQERRDLYWVVFGMDKQRTYISGRPLDLHFYDSDVRMFQLMTSQTLAERCWKAHVHMMAVWEEIYIYLYSFQAFRRGPAYRQSQIPKLDSLSRGWYARNGSLFSKTVPAEGSVANFWCIELKYVFHIGQVLVHRFSSDAGSQQVTQSNSRATLTLICDVFNAKQTEASISLLVRLVSPLDSR